MTKMLVDVPIEYDKMLGVVKSEKSIGSKPEVILKIIEEYFEKNTKYVELLKMEDEKSKKIKELEQQLQVLKNGE